MNTTDFAGDGPEDDLADILATPGGRVPFLGFARQIGAAGVRANMDAAAAASRRARGLPPEISVAGRAPGSAGARPPEGRSDLARLKAAPAPPAPLPSASAAQAGPLDPRAIYAGRNANVDTLRPESRRGGTQ